MRINIQNTARLNAALDPINGKAKTHTLRGNAVQGVAIRLEKQLDTSGIPKAARKGVVAHYIAAGPGKAYARKSRHFITTKLRLERGATGWFLTSAEKFEAWSDAPERMDITLSEEQAAIVRKAAMAPYTVKATEAAS